MEISKLIEEADEKKIRSLFLESLDCFCCDRKYYYYYHPKKPQDNVEVNVSKST